MDAAVAALIGAAITGLATFAATELTSRRTLAAAERQNRHAEKMQQAQFQDNARIASIERRRDLSIRIYAWSCGFAEAVPRPGILFGETPDERRARVLEQLKPLMEHHAEIIAQARIELEDLRLLDAYEDVRKRYDAILFGLALNKEPIAYNSELPYKTWVTDVQALDDAVSLVRNLARAGLGLEPAPTASSLPQAKP